MRGFEFERGLGTGFFLAVGLALAAVFFFLTDEGECFGRLTWAAELTSESLSSAALGTASEVVLKIQRKKGTTKRTMQLNPKQIFMRFPQSLGGSGEIRTHEGRKPLPVFKTGAFNHSATLPCRFVLPAARMIARSP